METTILLSDLADMIIVFSFTAAVGAFLGGILGRLAWIVVEAIQKKLKKNK